MKRKVLLSINSLVLLLSSIFFYLKYQELEEIRLGLEKIEVGFRDIDEHYSDPLQAVQEKISDLVTIDKLQGLSHDSIRLFLIKQRSLGRYYVDYQEAIKMEILEMSEAISYHEKTQITLFAIIAVVCLTNIGFNLKN